MGFVVITVNPKSQNSKFRRCMLPVPLASGSPIPGGALSDLGARSAARVGERFGSQRSNVSISVHEHARGRGLRADESEFARVSTVRKEAFAPAQQDRVDEQQNLVDQSLLEP